MFTPFDRTVVISAADRSLLLDLQPALNIEVIPNGIELARFRPQEHERDACTLLFVGNYEYAPNQDAARILAQQVLPAVRQALPESRLQLIGANPPAWLRDLESDQVLKSAARAGCSALFGARDRLRLPAEVWRRPEKQSPGSAGDGHPGGCDAAQPGRH